MGALLNSQAVYQHVNQAASNLQDDTEALKHNFLLRGFFKKRGYEDTDELKEECDRGTAGRRAQPELYLSRGQAVRQTR